jgi:THAP4-like, heme-binding beta-barrel domain
MRSIAFVLLLFPVTLFGQSSKPDSVWLPMIAFLGKWEGTGNGVPGIGKYERSYRFILDQKYIRIRNSSVYPPTDKNPKGEVHQDIGYISYDKSRRTFVLRQLHIEGFVNQYLLDSLSADGKTMVFESEAIENIPRGWRARESYQFSSEHEFTEVFELAAPGKPFEVYTRATLKKLDNRLR